MVKMPAPWFRKSTGRWYVTIRGKQHPLPVTDPNDAAGAWNTVRELVAAMAARADAAKPGRPEPVAALVAEYLNAISHKVNARTRKGYESYLRRFVAGPKAPGFAPADPCARFGACAAGRIDPASVEKDAAAETWSDSNRANYLWTVQAFVRWCGAKEFRLTRPAKESRGAAAVISEDTQRKILREASGDFHQYCRLLWAVGCRPMEAARLTAEGIDWATGTATLRQHKTRRKGKRRVLYLNTESLAILREQADKYKGTGPLFRGLGGRPFTLSAVVQRFLRVSEKVGVSVSAYCYRHTYITRALARGLPDTHVAALVGHTSTKMLHDFYSHVNANAALLKEAAEKAG